MYPRKLTRQVVSNTDFPVVSINAGKLRGTQIEDGFVFRGIKYAKARRFHMPEEIEPWEGTKDAVMYGSVCPELETVIPKDQQICPHYYLPQNEDCLFLNIWTPSIDRTSKKPVMVWIHGGGWFAGSSVEQFAYDGENLSAFGDVVVVSLNHRLNCLGYLDLSAYGEEYVHSNHVGLADLVMALKWIHENICCFGGNPENVTIFGQSGGGSKVLSLMQTPDADGLYAKAIVQSGGSKFFGDNGQPAQDMSKKMGELIVEKLGLTKERISEIETVPYWILANAVLDAEKIIKEQFGSAYRWEPLPDFNYFFGSPLLIGFRQETASIPMIMGSTFGEGRSNSRVQIGDGYKNKWDEQTTKMHIRDMYGDRADAIVNAFTLTYPEHKLADLLYIDTLDRYKLSDMITQRVSIGASVWNYIFKLESPINNGTVAWHCSDIPYVFHNSDYIEAAYIPGVSEKLQDMMARAWVAFARCGDPNFEGLPNWTKAERGILPTILFDREIRVKADHDKELLKLLPRTVTY